MGLEHLGAILAAVVVFFIYQRLTAGRDTLDLPTTAPGSPPPPSTPRPHHTFEDSFASAAQGNGF